MIAGCETPAPARWGLAPLTLVVALALWTTATPAAERPLWELAAGGGVLSLPYYRGSEENRVLPVPFIYPVYRGDVLKVDEEGIRGLFFESDRVTLDFSADGTVPASDDDVDARRGMPELDATFQLGPSLTVDLWQREAHHQKVVLNLPVRGVLAVDGSPDYVGLAASPRLTYERDVRFADRYWRVGLTGGLELGSDGLHDYFYTVDPQFEIAGRPAYEAGGGYAGTRFTLSARSRLGRQWVGAFLRYDNVGGSVFEDSPLVRRTGNISAGVVFAWFFAESDKTVTVPDTDALRY